MSFVKVLAVALMISALAGTVLLISSRPSADSNELPEPHRAQDGEHASGVQLRDGNARRALESLVLDSSGNPATEAHLRLYFPAFELDEDTLRWPRVNWESLDDLSLTIAVDQNGGFQLPSEPAGPVVLSAGELGQGSASILAELPTTEPLVVHLEHGDDVQVRLEQASETETVSLASSPSGGGTPENPLRWFRRFTTSVDADGACRFPSPGGHCYISAPGYIPWQGIPGQDPVVLQRGQQFDLYATVIRPQGSDEPAAGQVYAKWGDESLHLDHFADSNSTTRQHMQFALPSDAKELYLSCRLGDWMRTAAISIGNGLHEAAVSFDFRPERFSTIKVVDSNLEPVYQAKVSLLWQASAGVEALESWTSPNGRASLAGPCPESVTLRVEADGYAIHSESGFAPRQESDDEYIVTLVGAGAIEGQVLAEEGGAPVESYHLFYWTTDEDVLRGFSYSDPDGKFQLPAVPLGKIHLRAIPKVEGLAPSHAVLVENTTETETQTLYCPKPGIARGQVIDASTGEGIQARVQTGAASRFRTIGYFSEFVPTLADGTFEVPVGSGHSSLRVAADGYEELHHAYLSTPEGLEAGLIRLSKLRDLVVTVTGHGQWENTWLSTEGDHNSEMIWVPEDGRVVIPDVKGGAITLVLTEPSGYGVERFFDLIQESDWQQRIDVPTGSLRVRVSGRTPEILESLSLRAWCVGDDRYISQTTINGDGEAHLRGLREGETLVEILMPDFRVAASRIIVVGAEDLVEFHIEDEAPVLEIKDLEGNPLPGANVSFFSLERSPWWSIDVVSDAQGIVHLGETGFDTLQAVVQDGTRFDAHNTVHLNSSNAPEPLTFDTRAAATFSVEDDGEPLSSFRFYLSPVGSEISMGLQQTDANGTASQQHLSSGPYTVRVATTGTWLLTDEIVLHDGPNTIDLEVVRLGSCRLEIPEDGPASIFSVELQHQALGESLTSWIDEGRVTRPARGLTLDSAPLVLTGIPSGTYTWSARSADGRSLTGTVDVPPWGFATVVVQ